MNKVKGYVKFHADIECAIAKGLSDPNFGVEQLAQRMFTDRTNLYRKCIRYYKLRPEQLLRLRRMQTAYKLLSRKIVRFQKDVYYLVGYSDPSSFNRAYQAFLKCLKEGQLYGYEDPSDEQPGSA